MTEPDLPYHEDVVDEEKEREFHELVFPPECKHENEEYELDSVSKWCPDCGARGEVLMEGGEKWRAPRFPRKTP